MPFWPWLFKQQRNPVDVKPQEMLLVGDLVIFYTRSNWVLVVHHMYVK